MSAAEPSDSRRSRSSRKRHGTPPTPRRNEEAPEADRGRGAWSRESIWRESKSESTSQLGPTSAMRARDVARPDEADLAEAELNATVVRRNWQPPA